ncbi:MAG TPA: STAS domain-containing protein [Acidimicrobiales bacterium]|jgi:anti-anti-sigma factor|nr:STAS domain-containing protein [Acidimicrobiales bacterium]
MTTVGGRIRLAGELDFAGSPGLQSVLADVDGDIEIDCSQLTFIDSAGLRVLEERHRDCAAAGVHLALIDPPPCLTRLAGLLGYEDLLVRDGSRS